MKVILYMAITPNGMIARKDGATDFVSKTEWKSFSHRVKKTQNIIIGKNTFEIMKREKEFERLHLKKAIVVSSHAGQLKLSNKCTGALSPRHALEILQQEGFRTALVAGGAALNASFLKEKLVDEIYLDVEPFLLGTGKPLFFGRKFEVNLKLLGTKKLSKNEVQLHYKVVKK